MHMPELTPEEIAAIVFEHDWWAARSPGILVEYRMQERFPGVRFSNPEGSPASPTSMMATLCALMNDLADENKRLRVEVREAMREAAREIGRRERRATRKPSNKQDNGPRVVNEKASR